MKYKLLKDLPGLKAGVIFERLPWKYDYINREDYMRAEMGEQSHYHVFTKKELEEYKSWFKEVK